MRSFIQSKKSHFPKIVIKPRKSVLLYYLSPENNSCYKIVSNCLSPIFNSSELLDEPVIAGIVFMARIK